MGDASSSADIPHPGYPMKAGSSMLPSPAAASFLHPAHMDTAHGTRWVDVLLPLMPIVLGFQFLGCSA